MGSAIRIDWLRDPAALAGLETQWRELEASVEQRTHVSTFDFLYPWYRHYSGEYGGEPFVGLAWEGDRLAGIAPLTLKRGTIGRVPVTRVDFAPTDSIAGEFLVNADRPDIPIAFLQSLNSAARFDVICLNGFEQGSALLASLEKGSGGRFCVETESHAYAVVELAAGYDTYWAGLSGDVRRKLNHRARKIHALGVQVDSALPIRSVEEAHARALRMIAINEASYKLEGRTLADHHRSFLLDIVERLARRGRLSLPIAAIGGRDAAFILGVIERGRFYDITLSYDESFAKLGPGMYLMQETLKQFAAAGIHTVISHGAHPYKRTWSTRFVPQTRIFLFRRRPRAAVARLVRFGLQPFWRYVGGVTLNPITAR